MKKLLTVLTITTLCISVAFAANSTVGNNLKNAVKNDVKNTINTAQQAQASSAQAKKDAKIKELNAKIAALTAEKNAVMKDTKITETQKALKLEKIQRQIAFYTKQIEALK